MKGIKALWDWIKKLRIVLSRRFGTIFTIAFLVVLSIGFVLMRQLPSYQNCCSQYYEQYKTQSDQKQFTNTDIVLRNIICSVRTIDRHNGSVIALATILIMYFTFLLWSSTHKMWGTTKDTANAAQRSANAVVRMESPIIRVFSPPLVSIFSSTSVEGISSQSLYVSGLKFVNHGRTPAFPERLDTGWMVINKLPTTPVYTNSNDLSASDPIITETFDMTETAQTIEPTADQWDTISKGTRLWYYGCLYYRNFMNDRQEFRFCWCLFNAAPMGQSPVYSFLSYGDIPEVYTKNT